MAIRSVEDQLREEYFVLLPEVRKALEELEVEIRHSLIRVSGGMEKHERIVISSRIKDCESALQALRRRQEGVRFDPDRAHLYTLRSLHDLAGVRVLAFPHSRLLEIDELLRERFPAWTSDPVPPDVAGGEPLAFKYHGYCAASTRVRAEFQVVPMLIGLFWEIEHSVIYKPTPQLKSVAASLRMRRHASAVIEALQAFENEFQEIVRGEVES